MGVRKHGAETPEAVKKRRKQDIFTHLAGEKYLRGGERGLLALVRSGSSFEEDVWGSVLVMVERGGESSWPTTNERGTVHA